MTPLETAKDVERRRSAETSVHIPLNLLQDLIAEIERLRVALQRIADEDYEPIEESFTLAAIGIARAALDGDKT